MKLRDEGYSHFKQVEIAGDCCDAGNGIKLMPGVTGAASTIAAVGDDANVSLRIDGKGTGVAEVNGSGCFVASLSGATIHAGIAAAFTAPYALIVTRVIADITTKSTSASTLDIGYTATGATTGSDTFLDGIDSGTAAAVFDSGNYALDSGANALAQKMASGKFITVKEATGDATGLVGKLYIFYTRCA